MTQSPFLIQRRTSRHNRANKGMRHFLQQIKVTSLLILRVNYKFTLTIHNNFLSNGQTAILPSVRRPKNINFIYNHSTSACYYYQLHKSCFYKQGGTEFLKYQTFCLV